ncbi:deubiquitinase OTUD6B-like [Amphiura filiformis]|uniref:deubiquitinase OTUD6B-like n=1 Tax=Amphiura filiformis TaxID=82378 RepID=UPI003B214C39
MADTRSPEVSTNEEKMLHKHRKEKKELQAKIQALKHGIPKGDKKKKKEIMGEISKMEAELASKQAEERKGLEENMEKAATESSQPQENGLSEQLESSLQIDPSGEEQKPGKLSKAQKRRNKKAAKEKEREQRITEEEKNNVYSARNVEEGKLKAILTQRELLIKEIPSDGHCLYNAVLHQLSRRGIKTGIEDLRRQVAEYMRSHVDDFLCFLSKPDTGDPYSLEEYGQYCDEIATTAAWGGQHEISAMVQILKLPIQVLQADGPVLTIGEEYETQPVILTYHRHAFGLGEHYNSVVPVKESKNTKPDDL